MYLGGESRALSIENHVTLTQQYIIFILNKKMIIDQKSNYLLK